MQVLGYVGAVLASISILALSIATYTAVSNPTSTSTSTSTPPLSSYSIRIAQIGINIVFVYGVFCVLYLGDAAGVRKITLSSPPLGYVVVESTLSLASAACVLLPVAVPSLVGVADGLPGAELVPPVVLSTRVYAALAIVGLAAFVARKSAGDALNWSVVSARRAAAARGTSGDDVRPWRVPLMGLFATVRHPTRLAHAGIGVVALFLISQQSCPIALYAALFLMLFSQLVVGTAGDEAAFGKNPRLAAMYAAYQLRVPYKVVPYLW